MLRQFHYIDQNGKDQGVNVRNRSAELGKLLGDVEAIRSERKKARANKNKYGGVEGGAGTLGGFSGGSGRYGGFGSETGGFGGYQGEVYGDGGGFGGRETDFGGTQRRADQFEEYDEDEEGGSRPTPSRSTPAAAPKKAPPKPKEPEQDLFEFGDDEPVTVSNGKATDTSGGALADLTAPAAADDDDFDDFQSATSPSIAAPSGVSQLGGILSPPPTTSTTTSATQFAAPQPVAPTQTANFNTRFNAPSPVPSQTGSVSSLASPPVQPQASQPYKPSGPNYFTSVNTSMNSNQSTPSAFSSRPAMATSTQSSLKSSSATPTSMANLGKPASKSSAQGGGGDAFANLWSTAGSKSGIQSKPASKGPDLASMAKAKSEATIWGAPAATATGQQRAGATNPTPNTASNQGANALGNGLDDLLG
jgi:epsin